MKIIVRTKEKKLQLWLPNSHSIVPGGFAVMS